MKLEKKKMILLSFMLFSLFFGAGNLIFPPFLGQNAGDKMPFAIATFLITAVLLPVLGLIVVAQFEGIDKLASKVGKHFGVIFTILVYLSIGPGLGIPRAASVPFEMAVAPYLPEDASFTVFMLIYSAVFFIIASWIAMTPNKLVERVGKVLTPALLVLIVFFFISFLIKGEFSVASAVGEYKTSAAAKGFLEGYQTMDTISALNFGLVLATTLGSLGIKDRKGIVTNTIRSGAIAGLILSAVYLMLSYMGMASSNVYPIQENGAWTLRCIIEQLFGTPGAILLAAIFTLACLTTCVGLITSTSQYFASIFKKISYRGWVFIISGFSFIVCNQGLNTILSISVPILNAIYPIAIMLIILGLSDKRLKGNKYIYPVTITFVGITSILYSLETLKVPMGKFGEMLHKLPLYSLGLGWVLIAVIAVVASIVAWEIKCKTSKEKIDKNDDCSCENECVECTENIENISE